MNIQMLWVRTSDNKDMQMRFVGVALKLISVTLTEFNIYLSIVHAGR